MKFMKFEKSGKYLNLEAIAWVEYEHSFVRAHLLNSGIVTFKGTDADRGIGSVSDRAAPAYLHQMAVCCATTVTQSANQSDRLGL
jgi:hypothetical protein